VVGGLEQGEGESKPSVNNRWQNAGFCSVERGDL